jgi:hypothetical protein
MMHRVQGRQLARLLLVVVLTTLVGATMVRAYAEEPLCFRDPQTGEVTDDEISTIHDDLTYVLALAAGFSQADSAALQVWDDQLVDSEELGPGTAISYTNCSGAFPPTPTRSVAAVSEPRLPGHSGTA